MVPTKVRPYGITLRAQQECAKWLMECLQLGWTKDCLDALEVIWWQHHNEHGNLRTKKDFVGIIAQQPESGDVLEPEAKE